MTLSAFFWCLLFSVFRFRYGWPVGKSANRFSFLSLFSKGLLSRLKRKKTIWDEVENVQVDTAKLEHLFENRTKELSNKVSLLWTLRSDLLRLSLLTWCRAHCSAGPGQFRSNVIANGISDRN